MASTMAHKLDKWCAMRKCVSTIGSLCPTVPSLDQIRYDGTYWSNDEKQTCTQ
jgi:hypothetical protein